MIHDETPQGFNPPRVVDAHGRSRDERCPRCRAPKTERVSGTTFGPDERVLCGKCGYEFPAAEVSDGEGQ